MVEKKGAGQEQKVPMVCNLTGAALVACTPGGGATPFMSSAAALSDALPVADQRTSFPAAASTVEMFEADARIEVPTQETKAMLFEEAAIPVRVAMQGVEDLAVVQHEIDANGRLTRVDNPLTPVPLQHKPGGDDYITIIPASLGKVQVSLSGHYPDGGPVFQTFIVDVHAPNQSPLAVNTGYPDSLEDRLHFQMVDLGFAPVKTGLLVYAIYDHHKIPVRVPSDLVAFRVRQHSSEPRISVDPATGEVLAVAPSHALSEASFAGKTSSTCVVVEHLPSDQSKYSSSCEDLLEAYER